MPGFLSSVIYTCTSFLLGVILVNQIVDYDLLYVPLTQAALDKAYTHYQTWWDAPVGVKALLHVAAIAPLLALVVKLNAWTESAIFFDGSALALEVGTIVLYLTVHIPALRTFLPPVTPTPGAWTFLPAAPPREVPPSAEENADAVRVLAAGNALVALCLVGVIGMQAGQQYALRAEEREQRLMDEKAARDAERIKKDA